MIPSGRDYSADSEFQKLCARRSDVDLTVAALELARDANAELQFEKTLGWIDQVGGDLRGPVARAHSEIEMLQELGLAISQTHGIYGDATAYENAESSYLPSVIEKRRGIPISLSVLYMAVAERAGIELAGVSAPAHFLTRYDSSHGPLFIDAFMRGRVMNLDDCVEWLQAFTRWPRHRLEPTLQPATPRTTIIRMLNNLKNVHARHADWIAAWNVQHRLATLQPASYAQRRDLGVLSLRAGRHVDAVNLLSECLKTCPADDRDVLQTHLEQAQRELARWN
jgi:regulator of sirC expression with transglutaminase-like and TPR domain